jgi:smad nuclear-interacting protein 1
VADLPLDHPSCSKQHAVLQYRLIEVQDEEGNSRREVKPYIMDLESTNGTFLNGERIESSRYYELKEKDMLKFGMSTREFVILHEDSVQVE